MKKILKRSLISLVVILLAVFTYINVKYSEVDSGIRLYGFVFDKFGRFDDTESFASMAIDARDRFLDMEFDFEYEEIFIPSENGDIRALMYRTEKADEDATGLLWLHGGGYAALAPESDLEFVRNVVGETNSVVIIPDYTLSSEKPYPAALLDAYDTLLWMKNNASELGINDDQLFVGGGSAGGGLTAATTLYARDLGEVNVAFQLPLFPMINDKMDLPSAMNNEAFIWDSKRNRIGWELYLGDLYLTDEVPYYAAPLRADDYSDLPPTFTYVGSLDPFRDETIKYVNELKQENIEVEFYEYKGAYHGFEAASPNADISKLAVSRLTKAYEEASKKYFMPQNKQ